MLEKLRTRHPIDIPAEDWGRRKVILTMLGLLFVLFLFVPLLLSLYASLLAGGELNIDAATAVAAGFGVVVLVLVVGGLIGKPGHDR